MNEVRTLMESFWVIKDQDKETYYRVKRAIPGFRKFVRDQLGWRLISNEQLLKLEKLPAHAESFMGITAFQDVRDYCILCAILIFLEDKEEQEQFLLSELVEFVGLQLRKVMEVDWNSFTQRKSLVRSLQYVESKGMLKAYDGSSESLSQGMGQEVLYENTGLSRYFASNFPFDISGYTSYLDFEREGTEELETDRGHFRINRVYRQLAVCPAMYWKDNEDPDSLYLKNQRQWVEKYMEENLGGRLDIHRNAAFWMVEEDDTYGRVHPREAMLPELVMLLCGEIRGEAAAERLQQEEDGRIYIDEERFARLLLRCRDRWKDAWSKEYREMEQEKLLKTVKGYLTYWMMAEQDEAGIWILPAAGKTAGFYPKDYTQAKEKKEKEHA